MRCDVGLALQATAVSAAGDRRTAVEVTPEAAHAFKQFWANSNTENHIWSRTNTPLAARNAILAGFCPQLGGLPSVGAGDETSGFLRLRCCKRAAASVTPGPHNWMEDIITDCREKNQGKKKRALKMDGLFTKTQKVIRCTAKEKAQKEKKLYKKKAVAAKPCALSYMV
jgi:5-methylcytosine-specific restriction endonuclease McrA